MATTASAIQTFEPSTVDDMDLHSDNGIELGDGDIDLDLEPVPPQQSHDDDMSIQDAASINGPDDYTEAIEQDDFMVDHDDVIEEDVDISVEVEDVIIDQHDMADAPSHQEDASAIVDEDLVDYSDDEGHVPQGLEESTHEEHNLDVQHEETDDEGKDHSATADETHSSLETDKDISNGTDQSPDAEPSHAENTIQQDDNHSHIPDPSLESESEEKELQHTNDEEDDGGVQLQDPKSVIDQKQNEWGAETHFDHREFGHEDERDENGEPGKHEEHEHNSFQVRPVTVNYAGNELWLFKDHDPDNSGDWLLEDMALAKTTMSDLFRACRTSLGDDVSQEHEIGFRFDNLHNLELYEDNTACVAVSLERLVDLYHTLHAQDDNHEPESFYMSLLFRPRFATLLSDIAKYAEQGHGYSGLASAVAAGDTHFPNVFSSASTDEPTEWDNDESEEDNEEKSRDAIPSGDEQAEHRNEQPDNEEIREHNSEYDHPPEEENEVFDETEQSPQVEWNGEHGDTINAASVNKELVDDHHSAVEETSINEDAPSNDEGTVHFDDEEELLINYGEDEDAEPDIQNENDVPTEHSQSSSTVQGDELEPTQDKFSSADLEAGTEDNGELYRDQQGQDENDEHDEGDEGVAQLYQDYVQDFDEHDPFQDFQQDGAEETAINAHFENSTNQDYGDVNYEDVDQQLPADFMLAAEFDDVDNTENIEEGIPETTDLTDMDNAPDWSKPEDVAPVALEDAINESDIFETSKEDEEDDTADSTAPATSSTADAVTVSSGGLKGLSPQGQKRSVDEAGHAGDDALECTDAKRPRV